jgi:hypothetical protein
MLTPWGDYCQTILIGNKQYSRVDNLQKQPVR